MKTTPKRLIQKRLKPIAWLIFCLSAVLLVFWAGHLWINVTDSMPMGIWRLQKASPDVVSPARGQVVAFCPPNTEIFRKAKEVGILQSGSCESSYMPLLKEVMGLPGDVIEYSDAFSINGRKVANSTVLAINLDGASLPLFTRLVVPEGKVWLMSSHSTLSFDSRYFGLVDLKRLVGVAEPLIVSN